MTARSLMVCRLRNSTAPFPCWSFLDRRTANRPVPSSASAMSPQVRAAASSRLSKASRMTLQIAMSTRPRLRLVSTPSRRRRTRPPDRCRQAVDRILSSASALSAAACCWTLPICRTKPPSALFTNSFAVGSGNPAARWAAPIAARRTLSVEALAVSASFAKCAATISGVAGVAA